MTFQHPESTNETLEALAALKRTVQEADAMMRAPIRRLSDRLECTWCGHGAHQGACEREIVTEDGRMPCPCSWRS